MTLVLGMVVVIPFIPPYYFWGKSFDKAREGVRNYDFDGSISREVLESYLSRAVTYERVLVKNVLEDQNQGNQSDAIRFILNTGAKFIGRAVLLWNYENTLISMLDSAKVTIEEIHAVDPEIILQAGVFETVSNQVESLEIPSWVFEAFGLPIETRNFAFDAMYDVGGKYDDMWGPNTAVPDITRVETKMWIYYLSVMYINIGVEAIHFGQVHLTGYNDPLFLHWSEVIERVRAYGHQYARRHWVLCDAHTVGIVIHGNLLFDFHSSPMFPDEIKDQPQEVELNFYPFRLYPNIYIKSKGGTAPSGWVCDHLPYLVEIDNYGVSNTPGEYTEEELWVWGYDEMSWFANQPEEARNEFLHYVVIWLENNDPNGFLQMPGGRQCVFPPEYAFSIKYYFANTQSAYMPHGYNQEETIKQIWQDMPGFYLN